MRKLLVLAAVAACGAPDGTLTVLPIAEDSIEAAGVLAFLNGPAATLQALDVDAGLDQRAAQKIFAHVRGADAQLGTADDDLLGDLAELDAIPFVGPAAIADLTACVESMGLMPDFVVEGVAFTENQAEAVLEMVNGTTYEQLHDEVGLPGNAVQSIIAARPIAGIANLGAVKNIGPATLTRLRDFVTADAPSGCQAAGGTYDTVPFTAAEECQTVAFANLARYSETGVLTTQTRRVAYGCGPSSTGAVTCTGFHGQGGTWTGLAGLAEQSGVSKNGMLALKAAAADWQPTGLAYDTVASTWQNRTALRDEPVLFEKVFVTAQIGTLQEGASTYACVELRDAPEAPSYLPACLQWINADSAPGCSASYETCMYSHVGEWVSVRGTLRSSSLPGGYKLNVHHDGPSAANPAL